MWKRNHFYSLKGFYFTFQISSLFTHASFDISITPTFSSKILSRWIILKILDFWIRNSLKQLTIEMYDSLTTISFDVIALCFSYLGKLSPTSLPTFNFLQVNFPPEKSASVIVWYDACFNLILFCFSICTFHWCHLGKWYDELMTWQSYHFALFKEILDQ